MSIPPPACSSILSVARAAPARTVVAVVPIWRGKIGLFKQSATTPMHCGRWHCVTGMVTAPQQPMSCAEQELLKQTGLKAPETAELRAGPVVQVLDHGHEELLVHTFAAVTEHRKLTLSGMHVSHRWVQPAKISRFDGQVSWLLDVVVALRLAAAAHPPIDTSKT